MSTKKDRFIYVMFGSIQNVKDIHARVVEMNDNVILHDFIPPQFFD